MYARSDTQFWSSILWNLSILFFWFKKTKNVKSTGYEPKVSDLGRVAPSLTQHLIPTHLPPLGLYVKKKTQHWISGVLRLWVIAGFATKTTKHSPPRHIDVPMVAY
jgi:hypothetical protein